MRWCWWGWVQVSLCGVLCLQAVASAGGRVQVGVCALAVCGAALYSAVWYSSGFLSAVCARQSLWRLLS